MLPEQCILQSKIVGKRLCEMPPGKLRRVRLVFPILTILHPSVHSSLKPLFPKTFIILFPEEGASCLSPPSGYLVMISEKWIQVDNWKLDRSSFHSASIDIDVYLHVHVLRKMSLHVYYWWWLLKEVAYIHSIACRTHKLNFFLGPQPTWVVFLTEANIVDFDFVIELGVLWHQRQTCKSIWATAWSFQSVAHDHYVR